MFETRDARAAVVSSLLAARFVATLQNGHGGIRGGARPDACRGLDSVPCLFSRVRRDGLSVVSPGLAAHVRSGGVVVQGQRGEPPWGSGEPRREQAPAAAVSDGGRIMMSASYDRSNQGRVS